MIEFLNKILEKYSLQENLEWIIDEKKEITIRKLKDLTKESYYFTILDLTIPKEKKFIGTVKNNEFIIRKRFKMLKC